MNNTAAPFADGGPARHDAIIPRRDGGARHTIRRATVAAYGYSLNANR